MCLQHFSTRHPSLELSAQLTPSQEELYALYHSTVLRKHQLYALYDNIYVVSTPYY